MKVFLTALILMSQIAMVNTAQADVRGGIVIGTPGFDIGIGFGDGRGPRGPGWGRGPGHGGRGEVVCTAHNRRGMTFRARGWGRQDAQQRVLDKCYSVSRFCYIDSCWRR